MISHGLAVPIRGLPCMNLTSHYRLSYTSVNVTFKNLVVDHENLPLDMVYSLGQTAFIENIKINENNEIKELFFVRYRSGT